jgi:hypothetical protein
VETGADKKTDENLRFVLVSYRDDCWRCTALPEVWGQRVQPGPLGRKTGCVFNPDRRNERDGEGGDPMPIYTTDGGDTWLFGSLTGRVYYATINRITGHVTFSLRTPKKIYMTAFEGVCHKTEKLF